MIEAERPEGVIVQFGGQTPLKIAMDLDKALKANPIPAASGACGAGAGDREGSGEGEGRGAGKKRGGRAGDGRAKLQTIPTSRPSRHMPHVIHAGNGNVRIWGTSPDSIDIAEDRDRWMEVLTKLNIRQPAGGSARSEKVRQGWGGWVGGLRRQGVKEAGA